MPTIPRPPAIPASLAAIVTMAGLFVMYWSLTNLGLLTPAGTAAPVASGGGITPAPKGPAPVTPGGGVAPPSGITPRTPGSGGVGGGK